MSRVIWTRAALLDVQRIYRFLARMNPLAAALAVKQIRAGTTILDQQPEVGRSARNMEPEYREWPIAFGDSGYVVLYRYHASKAVILAVRHQKKAGY